MTKRYTDMSPGDMLQALGDDAAKWAVAFRERFPEVPEQDLFGWFANAIENTWDTRCSRFTRDGEAWLDFQEQVFSNRRFWAELELQNPEDPGLSGPDHESGRRAAQDET